MSQSPPAEVVKPGKPPVWQTVAAVAISAALLWWAIKGVHFSELVAHLKEARLWPVVLSVILATSLFPLRVFRWRLLLRHTDGSRIAFGPLWHPIAMGFMANNILPFRAGELVRVISVSKLARVPVGASLSSLAVERIFDGLAIILLLTIALLSPGIPTEIVVLDQPLSLVKAATVAGALSAAALAAALAVVFFPRPAERVVALLVPSPKWSARINGFIESLRHGLSVLGSPARLAGVIIWSVGLWALNAASFWVAFDAFGISINYTGALLLQGVLAFGIAAPSAPGYVGVFEAAIKAVLALYGVASSVALAYALTYHITTFIPITLLGLWSLMKTGLGLKTLRGAAPSD